MSFRLNMSKLLYYSAIFLLFPEVFIGSLTYRFYPSGMAGMILITVCLAVFGFLCNKGRGIRIYRKYALVYAAVIGIVILMMCGSGGFISNFKPVVIFIFLILSHGSSRWHEFFFKLLLISTVFFAVTTIWLFFDTGSYLKFFANNMYPDKAAAFFQKNVNLGHTTGVFDHYSHLGIVLGNGLTLVAAIIMCRIGEKKRSVMLYILLAMVLVALVFCAKRGQLVFSVAGVLITALLYFRGLIGKRLIRTLIFVVAVIVLFSIIMEYSPILQNYVGRFSHLDTDEAVQERYSYWSIALNQFSENPIFGIGWKAFRTLNYKNNDVHNMYLQILCETGILGAIVFLTLFITCFVFATRNLIAIRNSKESVDPIQKLACIFSLSYQIYFFLYGLTGNPQNLYYSCMPYVIACSMTLYYYKALKRKTYSTLAYAC